MESERFDAVVRTLGKESSRRGMLGILVGAAGLGLVGVEGKGKRKGRGNDDRRKRGATGRGKGGRTQARREDADTAARGGACREAGHPCEGNQECCHPDTTICAASGPGAALRCTPCSDGEIACGNACIPACTAPNECHEPGACDPDRSACTEPTPLDGGECTTDDNTPGECVAGACREICLELGTDCGGASPCCDGLECGDNYRSDPPELDTCCIPAGGSCQDDSSTSPSGCCGFSAGFLPGGQEVTRNLGCFEGTCCQVSAQLCRTTADCCQHVEGPNECLPAHPNHNGANGLVCDVDGPPNGLADKKLCLRPTGAPCGFNRCVCADGYCVEGKCSPNCKPLGAPCNSGSECCLGGGCPGPDFVCEPLNQ